MNRKHINKIIFYIQLVSIAGLLVFSGCLGTNTFVSKKKRIELLESKVDELGRKLEGLELSDKKLEKQLDSVSKGNETINTQYKGLQKGLASLELEHNEDKEKTSMMRNAVISTQKAVKKIHEKLVGMERHQADLEDQMETVASRYPSHETGDAPEASDLNKSYRHGKEGMNDNKVILEYIGKKGDTTRTDVIESKLMEAQDLSDKGMLNEAINLYKEIIAADPDRLEAYRSMGDLYYDKGTYDKAIEIYKELADQDPDNADAHSLLGVTYAKMNMLDEAISELKKALGIDPNLADVHVGLAVAYLKKGMVDNAILATKKALELDPILAKAHKYLGIAYRKKGMTKEADKELNIYKKLTGETF